MNFAPNHKVTVVLGATAVGTTSVNTSEINMADYEGVVFVALFGAVTDGSPGIKAQGGAQSNGSDAADFAASDTADTAAAASGQAVVLDVYRPLQQYVRGVITRGGSTGAVIQGVIAIQYGSKARPVVNDATSIASTVLSVSPNFGTA
jgi:hypothetical protein